MKRNVTPIHKPATPGPWWVGSDQTCWYVVNRDTSRSARIGRISKGRGINYFDRAMTEADRRNRVAIAVEIPDDPDGQNDDRAEWADAAIKAFAFTVRMDPVVEGEDTVLTDLLTDMMHWCDRRSFTFADCLRRAQAHYEAEIDGELP